MSWKDFTEARVKVRREIWYRVKAKAALQGKTLAEFIQEVLEKVAADGKE
jgi:predicted DNA binding CopG/RHH family protein